MALATGSMHPQGYIFSHTSNVMTGDKDLEKMYSELEKIYGESLEEKSAEAYHKSQQKRMDVEVVTDSENNPLRVTLTFGPHHFIELGLIDDKVHVLKGETHHGTMYEASSVGSEWESGKSSNDNPKTKYFDELPEDHQKVNFSRSVDDLTLYYLRPYEE